MKLKIRKPLNEAAQIIGVEPELIIQFVQYEWIIPADWENRILDEEDLARVHLIRELQLDFGVNNEAIPIILHLLDQLNLVLLERPRPS